MNRRGFLGRLLSGAVLGAVNGWLPGKARSFTPLPEAVPVAKGATIAVPVPGTGAILVWQGTNSPGVRDWLERSAAEIGKEIASGKRWFPVPIAPYLDSDSAKGDMWLTL